MTLTRRGFLVAGAAAVGGCGGGTPAAGLRIAAAANLKGVLPEIIAAAGVQATVTYGGSGTLAAQITNGSRFDLFLSADADFPAQLTAAGQAEAPFAYAVGRLALFALADSKLDLAAANLAAVADPAVRKVAIATPRVAPYGRAAEAALKSTGRWDAIAAKLVYGDNVEQVAAFVETGGADVGFVPLSLAKTRGKHAVVPATLHPRILQVGVVLTSAADPVAARRFANFLLSDARPLFAAAGYEPPTGP